jgi:hypothetical protein
MKGMGNTPLTGPAATAEKPDELDNLFGSRRKDRDGLFSFRFIRLIRKNRIRIA